MTSSITVAPRYRGPARSANGGYISGLLAEALRLRTGHAVATVTLRRPPPLRTSLDVRADDEHTLRCEAGGELVAEVTVGHFTDPAPEPVPYAVAATTEYPGLSDHPFPGCFTCGPEREDGLRLFAGPVPGRDGTVATVWTPREPAEVPIVWAALDCPGGWSVLVPGRPMVLGRMTAEVSATPLPGGEYVVVGRNRGVDGRKAYTSSALFDHAGGLLARAEATWIVVDPADFR
ncbi:MAG TPA: hypothetical protein VGD72_06660 [Mycobacteriales bacterium]|jgi:hypothetical protein